MVGHDDSGPEPSDVHSTFSNDEFDFTADELRIDNDLQPHDAYTFLEYLTDAGSSFDPSGEHAATLADQIMAPAVTLDEPVEDPETNAAAVDSVAEADTLPANLPFDDASSRASTPEAATEIFVEGAAAEGNGPEDEAMPDIPGLNVAPSDDVAGNQVAQEGHDLMVDETQHEDATMDDSAGFMDNLWDFDGQTPAPEQAPEQEPQYQFRTRNYAFVDPAVDDVDETGNFDPDAPEKMLDTPRKRTTGTGQPRPKPNPDQPRKQHPRSEQENRWLGRQYCIGLKFKTKRGRNFFKSLSINVKSNWPEQSINVLAESVDTQGRRTRRPLTKDEDEHYFLRNTPAARGCKSCDQLGLECSMLRPDGIYPCKQCKDEVCMPLVPPKRKQACESCRVKHVPCSYAQDPLGDHGPPCERCSFMGVTCRAGPALDPLRVRIGDDGLPAIPNTKPTLRSDSYERTYKTCAPCRRWGKWCSLVDTNRGKDPKPPCASCKQRKMMCTFEAVAGSRPPAPPSMKSAAAKSVATTAKKGSKRKRDKQALTEDGSTTEILTRISHPVKFLEASDWTNKGPNPCHFCTSDNPMYAILGHGELRRVTVLEWPHGEGYEEIKGGHASDGCEPSRMCEDCTHDRIRIIECPQHKMAPLVGMSEDYPASNSTRTSLPMHLLQKLVDSRNAPRTPRVAKWRRDKNREFCAVCPHPAQFQCHAAQKWHTSNGEQRLAAPTKSAGCGLRLCWTCKTILHGLFKGDFNRMLSHFAQQVTPSEYPCGLRADWDFLRRDGPLWRQIQHTRTRYDGTLPTQDQIDKA